MMEEEVDAQGKEDKDAGKLHDDDQRVEVRGLLNADHQDCRD